MKIIPFNPTRCKRSVHAKTRQPVSVTSSNASAFVVNDQIYATPQSMLAASYCLQAHGAYLEHYAPGMSGHSPSLSADLRTSAGGSWLYSVYSQARTDALLSDALTALSLVHCERQNTLQDSTLGSRAPYGKAVRTLTRRLATPESALGDSTLAAALLLVPFEVGQGST